MSVYGCMAWVEQREKECVWVNEKTRARMLFCVIFILLPSMTSERPISPALISGLLSRSISNSSGRCMWREGLGRDSGKRDKNLSRGNANCACAISEPMTF